MECRWKECKNTCRLIALYLNLIHLIKLIYGRLSDCLLFWFSKYFMARFSAHTRGSCLAETLRLSRSESSRSKESRARDHPGKIIFSRIFFLFEESRFKVENFNHFEKLFPRVSSFWFLHRCASISYSSSSHENLLFWIKMFCWRARFLRFLRLMNLSRLP